MNIAVINIKDLIKYALILIIVAIAIISGIIIIKEKEKFKESKDLGKEQDSSFLYCLEMEIPLMSTKNTEDEAQKEDNTNASYKILDTQIAVLNNLNEGAKKEEESHEEEEVQEEIKQENTEDNTSKVIAEVEKVQTQVISENNIEASYTNTAHNDIKVKNQSKYDITELLANASYALKNKNKVMIYHTHTCESYTASEKYNYQMTGAYRTTDLNYTVSRVRR